MQSKETAASNLLPESIDVLEFEVTIQDKNGVHAEKTKTNLKTVTNNGNKNVYSKIETTAKSNVIMLNLSENDDKNITDVIESNRTSSVDMHGSPTFFVISSSFSASSEWAGSALNSLLVLPAVVRTSSEVDSSQTASDSTSEYVLGESTSTGGITMSVLIENRSKTSITENSSTETDSTVDKKPNTVAGSKESIIVKLNSKLKALEANLTMSMMYLEDMSERYLLIFVIE